MSEQERPFPAVSAALLRELDRLYPNLAPRQGESHADLMWRGGARSVVDFLVEQAKRQSGG